MANETESSIAKKLMTPATPESFARKQLEERTIRTIAEQLGIKFEEVELTSRLIEDLGADSLDNVEIVMALEEEFEIELPDEAVEDESGAYLNFPVSKLVDIIEQRIG